MAHRTPTIDVIVRDEVTRALERQLRSMRDAGGTKGFGGLQNGLKGLENSIESVARGIGREFGALARIAGGGLLGAGFVAGITRTAHALADVARAATQHRYLAEQIGLTTAQLSDLVGRGRALGMSSEQTTAGIGSLSKNLRELKLLGENAGIYKSLVQAGGASGQRFADKVIAASRGPGGYDAGVRTFVKLMSETNAQAQRKLSELFGLGSIAFRDLNSLGLDDLPKAIELSEPAARAAAASLADIDRSFQNIKVTIAGALMPAFEQLARTVDQFLQGPGRLVVEQFAGWVSKIKIPWDDIGKGLQELGDLLVDVFKWVKKAITDVDPYVRQIGGWEPILIALGALFIASQHGTVTWALIGIATALQEIGEHDWILKKIADAVNIVKGGASGGGQKLSQFGSPYSKNIEDRRGQAPMSGGSSGPRSGYNLMGGRGRDDTEANDEDVLRQQVQGTTRQVLRLANFVVGSGGDDVDSGGAPSGQIRIPTVGRSGSAGRPTGPRGPSTPPTGPSTPPTAPAGPTTPPTAPSEPTPGPSTRPAGPTPGPQPAPATGGGKGVMLFAHGIISRYGNTSVEQVEADARRLAKARGYSGVEFIYGTPAQQTKRLRDRVAQGGVGGIVGFSGGAGPARTVGNETGIPTTTYGNPNVPGDATVPGVKHMPQTAALADQAERDARVAAGQQPTAPGQPQPPTTPGGPTTLPEVRVTPGPTGARVQEAQGRVAAIRRQPIDPQLKAALDYAAGVAGVTVRVTSGGQDPHGAHTGSHRHDYGRAADVDLLDADGNILPRGDPRRLTFLKAAASVGAGGTGAGYMNDPGHRKIHVGITGSRAIIGEGLGAYAGNPDERRAVAEGVAIFLRDRAAAARKLATGAQPDDPPARSPIVWSNQDEIDRLNREKELKDEFPQGGYTPIPGRSKIKLKISLRGPRGVKVAGEGSGAVGAATIERSDPSGGIEGFSPA